MMYGRFLLLILIYCYGIVSQEMSPFKRNGTTPVEIYSFDWNDYPPGTKQISHYVNKNFSIGATLSLRSSSQCAQSVCISGLQLIITHSPLIPVDLWCNQPAILEKQTFNISEFLSCNLNGFNASGQNYSFSATVQVHSAGTIRIFKTVTFSNNFRGIHGNLMDIDIVNVTPLVKKLTTVSSNNRQD